MISPLSEPVDTTTKRETNDLGDREVVAAIVKEFSEDALIIIHEFRRGHPGAENHMEQMKLLCRGTADLFMGLDSNFTPIPNWNSPNTFGNRKLGAYLRHAVATTKATDEPFMAYFEWLALQLVKCSMSLELGMIEEQAGPMLKELLSESVDLLHGERLRAGENSKT